MRILYLSALASIISSVGASDCAPQIGQSLSGVCHNFTSWGTAGFPLNGYSEPTTTGRFTLLKQLFANNDVDDVLCGYEMFPPNDYLFFNNADILKKWPYRYIPTWMASAEGPVGTRLGYPAGCACTQAEADSIMTAWNTYCGSVAGYGMLAEAGCMLSSNDVISVLYTVSGACRMRWTALFNLFSPLIGQYNTVQNFSDLALLGSNTVAGGGECAFAAGNSGLFILSKYPLSNVDQRYLTPGRGVIYAQVQPTGHRTPTQVFCQHATANLSSSTYDESNALHLYQINASKIYISEKVQQYPNHRVAFLGDPQFAIPRNTPPSNLIGNYLDSLAMFTTFAESLNLVDALQVQEDTQQLPQMAAFNPLAYNYAGLLSQGYNITVAHNYIGSRCPPDVHRASLAFNEEFTVPVAGYSDYTGYASDQFGIRTQVCEVQGSRSPSRSPRRSVSPSRSPRQSQSPSRSPRNSLSQSRSPRASRSPRPGNNPGALEHRRLAEMFANIVPSAPIHTPAHVAVTASPIFMTVLVSLGFVGMILAVLLLRARDAKGTQCQSAEVIPAE